MEDLSRRTVKLLEGLNRQAYVDAKGHSIGWGHFIKPGEEHLLTKTLTDDEAEKLLTKDIESHQAGINQWIRRPMSEQKKAALTSLAYNTGAKSDAVRKVVELYNQGKDKEAAAAFAAYNKAYNPKTGVKETNEVLVKRREFERRLFTAEGDVDVEAIHGEVFGKPGKKPLSVASSRSLKRFGSVETAMNENKSIFVQLQQMNLEFEQNVGANSEFLLRLRREGGMT
jgi:lysozyme